MNFTIGKQPCDHFVPDEVGYFGTQTHECYCGHKLGNGCSKSVAFCANCHTDHHEDGYENCICGGSGFNKSSPTPPQEELPANRADI